MVSLAPHPGVEPGTSGLEDLTMHPACEAKIIVLPTGLEPVPNRLRGEHATLTLRECGAPVRNRTSISRFKRPDNTTILRRQKIFDEDFPRDDLL